MLRPKCSFQPKVREEGRNLIAYYRPSFLIPIPKYAIGLNGVHRIGKKQQTR